MTDDDSRDPHPTDRIPNDELVTGGIYLVRARNFSVGIFTGDAFIGHREKMGSVYLDVEYLREMPGEDHRVHGTAWGLRRLGETGGFGGQPVGYLTLPAEAIPTVRAYMVNRDETWVVPDDTARHLYSAVLACLSAAELFAAERQMVIDAVNGSDRVLAADPDHRWRYRLVERERCDHVTRPENRTIPRRDPSPDYVYTVPVCAVCGPVDLLPDGGHYRPNQNTIR